MVRGRAREKVQRRLARLHKGRLRLRRDANLVQVRADLRRGGSNAASMDPGVQGVNACADAAEVHERAFVTVAMAKAHLQRRARWPKRSPPPDGQWSTCCEPQKSRGSLTAGLNIVAHGGLRTEEGTARLSPRIPCACKFAYMRAYVVVRAPARVRVRACVRARVCAGARVHVCICVARASLRRTSVRRSASSRARRCCPLTQRSFFMSKTAGDLVIRSSEKALISSSTV
eukprot:6193052-Pleurochrysis_carterae.AAC.1